MFLHDGVGPDQAEREAFADEPPPPPTFLHDEMGPDQAEREATANEPPPAAALAVAPAAELPLALEVGEEARMKFRTHRINGSSMLLQMSAWRHCVEKYGA